jgi:spore germination protein YaaH
MTNHFEYVVINSSFENICKRIDESLKHHSPYFIAIDFDETLWNNEQNDFNYFVKELILHLKKKYVDQICFMRFLTRKPTSLVG